MISRLEKFWIIFILRFAFGFFFLFAAINIFTYGVDKFATDLGKGFESTWIASMQAPQFTGLHYTGMDFVNLFLHAAPFIMTALAVTILTGILLRPALRAAALLCICFGLGKYTQNDIATTAADFLFALIICLGLYFMSLSDAQAKAKARQVEA
jgi:hypothetical protein